MCREAINNWRTACQALSEGDTFVSDLRFDARMISYSS